MIKKVSIIVIMLITLFSSVFSAEQFSVDPINTNFSIEKVGNEYYVNFNPVLVIDNSFFNYNINAVYSLLYYEDFGGENETEVYVLDQHVQFVGNGSSIEVSELLLPVELNISGEYYLLLAFLDEGETYNGEISIDNTYSYTHIEDEGDEEVPVEEEEGTFDSISETTTGLFGIVGTITSLSVGLIFDILPLMIIGAIVAMIFIIFTLILKMFEGNLKQKK